MRTIRLSLLASTLALMPAAAFSQQETTSPDDYVCALTGECAEQAQDEATQPSGSPRVSATRSFSLAAPSGSTPARTPARTTPNRPRQTAAATPRRPAVATAQPGRVNIRVAFGPGSTVLSAAAQAEVRAFAAALQRPQLASMRFRIEGHTDSSGARATNLSLSQRRAQAVADYLASQGVAPTRLEVRGYGPDRPRPGRGAAARENRRVEAVRITS
jgi:outer membrane protein OmpA-like peptidoglycan-associated protein